MKYLNTFNRETIEKEAEEHLAYLLDNHNWVIEVVEENKNEFRAHNIVVDINCSTSVNWEDIKYDILPYLELVSNKYDISPFYMNNSSFNLSELENYKNEYLGVNDITFRIYKKSLKDKFNEAFITVDGYYELKKFCKDHLAYLIDRGFKFDVDVTPLSNTDAEITITNDEGWFLWKDVEDDIIPFLQMLDRKYKVKSVIFGKDIRTLKQIVKGINIIGNGDLKIVC
jgi:hypothetical protein